MTRDDIIRMAREAGLVDYCDLEGDSVGLLALVTLCQDVAAAEREACARVCEELDLKSEGGELGAYVAGWSDGTDDCAAAIRARS